MQSAATSVNQPLQEPRSLPRTGSGLPACLLTNYEYVKFKKSYITFRTALSPERQTTLISPKISAVLTVLKKNYQKCD